MHSNFYLHILNLESKILTGKTEQKKFPPGKWANIKVCGNVSSPFPCPERGNGCGLLCRGTNGMSSAWGLGVELKLNYRDRMRLFPRAWRREGFPCKWWWQSILCLVLSMLLPGSGEE